MTAATRPTILLVDSDTGLLDRMRETLSGRFDCLATSEGAEAIRLLAENFVHVVLCDAALRLPAGATLLAEVRRRWPETSRVVLRHREAPVATRADAGEEHILSVPFPDDQLAAEVATAARLFQLARENDRLTLEMRCRTRGAPAPLPARIGGFGDIHRLPGSPMEHVVEAARQIALFDVPVLLSGEPSTGKRRLAQAIHDVSLRSDKPFLSMQCRGLTPEALALELFGARNGSVPNGQRTKIGLLQRADRGTLFLGGLETLPTATQAALLGVLQNGLAMPVGGHEPVRVQARLICGCGPGLEERVADGAFDRDLYYMLAAARLDLPPLRERSVDIGILAGEMLQAAAQAHGKPVFGLTDECLCFLRDYDWPGNLRELEAEIVRILIFSQSDVIGAELLSRHILQHAPVIAPQPGIDTVMRADGSLKDRIERIEARILLETLTRMKWNKSRAAAELGLSRVGLRAKIERFGLTRPDARLQEV